MGLIHPTAIVEDGAELGLNVSVGAYSLIGPRVRIGADSVIHPHVVVGGNTTIGARAKIFPFAAVGYPPQDLKHVGDDTRLVAGDDFLVREHVTIHVGTNGGSGLTQIGDKCVLLAGAHVAHDCRIGNNVVLINNALLGGHCVVADYVIFGAGAGIHQFVRIGQHAFIGGMSAVVSDVIPYGSVIGNRAYLGGLNIVGLKRRGFSRDQIHQLRRAYRLLFSNEGTLAERVEDVAKMFPDEEIVQEIVAFIRADSSRALCTPRNGKDG